MLSFADRTSARQVIQPTGNIAVTSSAGANGTLASFSIPAGTMRANSQMMIYLDLSSGGTGQTVSVILNDGSPTTVIAGTINNATLCRTRIRIANRNSTSAQRNAIEGTSNFTVATTPTSTSTKALGGNFTLSITTTNPGFSVTLESILVEIIP